MLSSLWPGLSGVAMRLATLNCISNCNALFGAILFMEPHAFKSACIVGLNSLETWDHVWLYVRS